MGLEETPGPSTRDAKVPKRMASIIWIPLFEGTLFALVQGETDKNMFGGRSLYFKTPDRFFGVCSMSLLHSDSKYHNPALLIQLITI